MKTTYKGWAIMEPSGFMFTNTTKRTRRESISAMEAMSVRWNWIGLRNRGYRAVRVTVTITPVKGGKK